jgi:CRP/FNR family transcriptional regulator
MIEIEELKKQILLQGLMEEEYQSLAAYLEYRHYEKGAVLFREGDPPEGIYLIKKGRVRISTTLQGQGGRQRTLVIFKDGNYFGDISTLEKRRHGATATALTELETFLLRFDTLYCQYSGDLLLCCRLLKRLALIASKNLRQMNVKYLRLEESF